MISIIIPTIRPQNIPNLLTAIEKAVSVPYEVIWEEDVKRIGAPNMVSRLVEKTHFDWIVFIGDDTIPEKDSIDTALNYALDNALLLVGFNDGHGKKATHWIGHKALLEKLDGGKFFHTGYIHNFCDDELRVKAEKLGVYGWCENAKIQHFHPAFGNAPKDESYDRQTDTGNWVHDQILFQNRNCRLSVVLIVKNEEAMLGECLSSVSGADEIIVVDTGSQDNTKEIAAQFTDKVYDFEWCDDYAKARNYALSKATGDWVLSIDADEVLEQGGIAKIRQLLFTHKHAIGIFMRSVGSMGYHVPRLFRNIPSVKWVGRIHELVNVRDYDPCDVLITYRYSPAHNLDPDRNIRILEAACDENPNDTRSMYYLAREYAYRKRWIEAENLFEKYIMLSTWMPEKADAHFMLALCYWYDGMGNGEKTRENCLKAMSINSNFKAPILLMAEASFESNARQWRRMAETADNSGTLFARERFDVI